MKVSLAKWTEATCAGNEGSWAHLRELLESHGCAHVDNGAVADHSYRAREEAVKALIGNHYNLLKDVCNPSPSLNIVDRELTQLELTRVSMALSHHVDEGLRETCRRLLGHGAAQVMHSSLEAQEARAAAARYLDGRIHTEREQCPNRQPDMSPAAGAAMKAVLIEVGSTAWEPLKDMLEEGAAKSKTMHGVASKHTLAAREEAARAVIGNHFNVLKDVCNPSGTRNIVGRELTQLNLQRVDASMAPFVDEGLREVCRRLLGKGQPEMNFPSSAAQEARAAMARYLDGRIQSDPEQKPGRTPDMSPAAAAAMKAVLVEVGSLAWEPLELLLPAGARPAQGAAASHSPKAREEAARALIGNHFNLLKDVCNPSPSHNIVGRALTQLELTRVDQRYAPHVDEGLREVARRLLGSNVAMPLNQSAEARAARSATARYLEGRIQSERDQKPGRKPDMSPAAAAAMIKVLFEVGADAGAGLMSAPATPRKVTLSLARDFEVLAGQLREGRRLTPRQLKSLDGRIRAEVGDGPVGGTSKACSIM